MSKITISKDAAIKADRYAEEARETLVRNLTIMEQNVNSHFSGLQDPAFKTYLALSEQLHDEVMQICSKMEDISSYCKKVVQWIVQYSET